MKMKWYDLVIWVIVFVLGIYVGGRFSPNCSVEKTSPAIVQQG